MLLAAVLVVTGLNAVVAPTLGRAAVAPVVRVPVYPPGVTVPPVPVAVEAPAGDGELVGMRTEVSKTFTGPDGSYVTVIAPQAVLADPVVAVSAGPGGGVGAGGGLTRLTDFPAVPASTSCTISSAAPGVSACADPVQLSRTAGAEKRVVVAFPADAGGVPADAAVEAAYVTAASLVAPVTSDTVDALTLTKSFTSSTTWTSPWTAPGGDTGQLLATVPNLPRKYLIL